MTLRKRDIEIQISQLKAANETTNRFIEKMTRSDTRVNNVIIAFLGISTIVIAAAGFAAVSEIKKTIERTEKVIGELTNTSIPHDSEILPAPTAKNGNTILQLSLNKIFYLDQPRYQVNAQTNFLVKAIGASGKLTGFSARIDGPILNHLLQFDKNHEVSYSKNRLKNNQYFPVQKDSDTIFAPENVGISQIFSITNNFTTCSEAKKAINDILNNQNPQNTLFVTPHFTSILVDPTPKPLQLAPQDFSTFTCGELEAMENG